MKYVIPILMILLMVGCSSNSIYHTKEGKKRKTHKQYRSNEDNSINNVELKAISNNMICSYYGDAFHGNQTSNGEIFDMYKLTCAHKTLPFNTMLKVTNPDNGKSVVVRVNDRGPFVPGRDLDLSYGAAKKVGLIASGVKELKVEILKK